MLSGVVDRMPLHGLLPLLAQGRRALAHDAPLVVVSEPDPAAGSRGAVALDLLDGRPLHARDLGAAAGPGRLRRGGAPPGGGRAGRPVRAGGRHPLVSGIHHFVPVLHRGDAVGRHTLRLRDATRARGFRSEIYVDTVDPDTEGETVPVLDYPVAAERGDVVVYQFATASAMAPWLAGPDRDPGRQLPQHHAARPDGALGQPSRPGSAARPGGPAPAGAAHRARRSRTPPTTRGTWRGPGSPPPR